MVYRCLFMVWVFCLGFAAEMSGATVRGRITDADGAVIPYVNIFVEGTTHGVAANSEGDYVLTLDPGEYSLRFSALGFEPQRVSVELRAREIKVLNITLEPASANLEEFEVVADKRDRAKEIMKLVRENRKTHLDKIESFECTAYLKNSLEKIRKGPVLRVDSNHLEQYEIIRHDSFVVDTVHKRFLAELYEVSSTVYFESPNSIRETIHGYNEHEKRDRSPEVGRSMTVESDYDPRPFDMTPTRFRAEHPFIYYPDNTKTNINFYRNQIELPNVVMKPLLSPIAASSALSYTYDYEGYFLEEGRKIFKLKVNPILKTEALFNGYIFIEDSTWALKSVELSVNPLALNICREFTIEQHYQRHSSEAYLPASMSLDYTLSESIHDVFGKARLLFSDYRVNVDLDPKIFGTQIKSYDPEAFERDSTFWLDERPELLNASEIRFIDESDSLDLYYVSDEYYRKVDSAFNRVDHWTPLVGWGRRNRAKGSEIYIEGLLGQINPLGVGGYRHQLPIQIEQEFKDNTKLNLVLRPDIGVYNGDIKMKAGVGYTYIPKRFVRTFVRFGDFYERINPYSSIEQIFSRNNFVNARTFSVAQRMEVINGLFAELTYKYSDQRPITDLTVSPWEEFLFDDQAESLPFERYIKSEIRLDFQYRFRQKYFLRENKKIIVGSDFPELFGTWRKGIPDMFNSEVNFDYVELGVRDKMKLARFGSSSWQVYGGSFINKANLRLLEYKFLRGSDEFFFSDPSNSLQLLGTTFSTANPFVQFNYIHHFEGVLLNKVPLLNRLKLELAAGTGGLFVEEENFAQVELFAGLEKTVPIWKQLFRFGVYGVTSDSSVGTAQYTVKFGINFYNSFTSEWAY